MSRAILVPFHKYTPFGGEYYKPLFDFYLKQMNQYAKEFDKLYLLDSTWNFDLTNYDYENQKIKNIEIIKVDPSLRYYDAYKAVLPKIKESCVLFMDND